MAKVFVNPGVCGFSTEIIVASEDSRNCSVNLKSQCPNIQLMDKELQNIDGFKECFARFGDSQIFEVAGKHCKHAACPIPTGIIKGIEVTCGLAVARKAEIMFE